MADTRIINVGGHKVGINGLDQAIAEMTDQFAEQSDAAVGAEMLARLEPRNYFAPSALDQYAAALTREFRLMSDSRIINVGGHKVGINGLDQGPALDQYAAALGRPWVSPMRPARAAAWRCASWGRAAPAATSCTSGW